MATGTSHKDLEKYLMKVCKEMCDFAANEVYEAINFFLAQYYSEWKPVSYQRSEDFLRSAFKTETKQTGKGYTAVIGIDYESLNNYENATGYQVVSWANQALHGGIDAGTDTRVWDDSMDATINSGQLLKDCIIFLKGKGFTIL